MSANKYKTIQLPIEFVSENIDPIILDKKFGFSSRANLVIEAVKALLRTLKEEEA